MTASRLMPLAVLSALGLAIATSAAPPAGEVAIKPITFKAFKERLAKNPAKAKFTVVDAWATNCGPCKENFPHLVEMHAKYGAKGLEVISLSLDDRADANAIKAAGEFLTEKKAAFPNFYIDEDFGAGYEHLDINAIPAVFLYGPDGKELRRFTMDDPDNQFTYADVDKAVQLLLEGKPLPPEKGKSSKGK